METKHDFRNPEKAADIFKTLNGMSIPKAMDVLIDCHYAVSSLRDEKSKNVLIQKNYFFPDTDAESSLDAEEENVDMSVEYVLRDIEWARKKSHQAKRLALIALCISVISASIRLIAAL